MVRLANCNKASIKSHQLITISGGGLQAPVPLQTVVLRGPSDLSGGPGPLGPPLIRPLVWERRELTSGVRGVLDLSKRVWTHIVNFGQSWLVSAV